MRFIAGVVISSVGMVLLFRWVPPPASAAMIEARFKSRFETKHRSVIFYQWVDMKSISPWMPLAAVAAEDQKFPYHWGFDFGSIAEAVQESINGGRLRGASTISQQVAKNLFLWSGRSFIRKGLEAYFTVLLETLWSKHRILEVYLNIAQFGNGIYGVSAAARRLLKKKPSALTEKDAALLAAVLPNPLEMRVMRPSPYVMERRRWIEQQMKQLGGIWYLKRIIRGNP